MKRGRKIKRMTILLATLAMVFGRTGSAQAYTFVKLDVPGAMKTAANGINDSGDVVGYYFFAGAPRLYCLCGGSPIMKSQKVSLLAVVATIAGFVTGSSINAATIQYEYGALNRLIHVIYDDNSSIEYS